MMSKKGFSALAAAALVAIGAAIVSQRQAGVDDTPAGPMFPQLMDKAAGVAKVLIKKPGESVTLVRGDEAWVVKEKDDYPAVTTKIRQLVMGLSELQRVEAKTKNPQRYGRLGLAGVDEAGSTSTLVQLLDAADNSVAAVIVGDRQPSPASASRMSYYVRAVDDPQSWLVEGSLPETRSALDWLDQSLLKLGDDQVRSVAVHHADGEVVRVSRKDRNAKDFELAGLGSEEEIESQYAVNSIADTLKRLAMDDVKRAAGAEPNTENVTRVVLETFDGVRIKAAMSKEGEQILTRLEAEFDQALVDKADGADATPSAADAESKPTEATSRLTPQQQVERWSAQWRDWVYVIPDYQFETIGVKKADLLKAPRETAATTDKAEADETAGSQN